MKKSLLWIIVLLLSISIVVTFSLAGCKEEAAVEEAAAEEEVEEATAEEEVEEAVVEEEEEVVAPGTYTMKIGHTHGTDMPRHLSLLFFEQLVEKNSEGAIDVEIYPGGQLGTETEMLESVKTGALEGARVGCFDLVTQQLTLYLMPFLFDKADDFVKIARGPIGDEIAASASDQGLVVLATGDAGGFRQWTNNVRPIVVPEDIVGLKMRTPPVDAIIKIMEALGANPVSIAYVELYMALKTGVADGEENPVVNICDKKFYEVQKYITMANYQIHPDPFIVNPDWLNSLPAYLKDIVVDAGKESMKYSDTLMQTKEAAGIPIIEENMEVTTLTKEQKQVFIDMCAPVYDYYIDEGWFTQDLLDRARAELE